LRRAPLDGCAAPGDACDLDDSYSGICCSRFRRDIECCIDDPNPNDRRDYGQTCNEGFCEGVTETCESDDDCAGDTCFCEDGGCGEGCCDEPVTRLPDTSAGQGKSSATGWLAAAAGAAAFRAGKKLREAPAEVEATGRATG
jgi:hypothetical protein